MSLNKCRDVLTPQEGCRELNNPLYEVFAHPGVFWDNTAPGPLPHVTHPSPGMPVVGSGTRMGVGDPKLPNTAWGRWGQQVQQPCTSGTGTRAHLARAEGLQVGRGAPEKPSYGTTEGGDSRTPRAGTHSQGTSTWQEPASPGGELGTTGHSFLLISCQHPGIPARPVPSSCRGQASCPGGEPVLGMPLCRTPRFGSLHLLPLPSAAGVRH